MFKTFRKLEIFIIVVIIAVIGIIFAFRQGPVTVSTDNQTAPNTQLPTASGLNNVPASQVPATTIEYPGQNGKNALELLKAGHQVIATHYSFGDMVTGIDGITPDKSHFWALYVNGQLSQVGASDYVTKSTDKIVWQVDAVDSTK